MRQVRKNTSGEGPKGGFPKEGMREGPVKGWRRFSEEEIAYLKRRRPELVLEGTNDGEITKVLAGEMGRLAGSIRAKIDELVRIGELGKNTHNWVNYREEELLYLKKRREELILEGKKDRPISEILAGDMGRPARSIEGKIRKLVESGELPENPNKRIDFSEKEVAFMKKRRAELILEGKNDTQISRVLSGEMRRPACSIIHKIYVFVEEEKFEKNPNNLNDFSEKEVACIKKRRAEIILEGKTDWHIARFLAGEMERSAASIMHKIVRLVGSGELGENSNKRNEFGEEEIACLKMRRAELVLKGRNDTQISKVLARELERTSRSILHKINCLVEKGELGENSNSRRDFSGDDFAYITRRRAELILEGKNDGQISRVLAGEMERNIKSLDKKIRELIETGELLENPNKRGRLVSEEELAAELSYAVDMYLGDSP